MLGLVEDPMSPCEFHKKGFHTSVASNPLTCDAPMRDEVATIASESEAMLASWLHIADNSTCPEALNGDTEGGAVECPRRKTSRACFSSVSALPRKAFLFLTFTSGPASVSCAESSIKGEMTRKPFLAMIERSESWRRISTVSRTIWIELRAQWFVCCEASRRRIRLAATAWTKTVLIEWSKLQSLQLEIGNRPSSAKLDEWTAFEYPQDFMGVL